MAQKAKKDQAKNNAAALSRLHLTSLALNLVFLLFRFALAPSRSLVAYVVLSIPAFACQYALEAAGRPRFDAASGALRTAGQDLAAPGLTEYMFDVIWVTWGCLFAVIFAGNWAWLLWAVIPAYGVYLGSGLLGLGRQKMAQMQADGQPGPSQGNRRSRRAA
ncbi:hypothetical protein CDD81_6562 [Ophiocordyceps australis]|uniref:DUF788 domain-containing protein n=1 Tax=Ophiocordyceps australis TaxID=1399860 RepID=A0A2C5X9F2_9HYPO|nr:hypothetical protein CDD81_6562 [Ophiocordyceps australis]